MPIEIDVGDSPPDSRSHTHSPGSERHVRRRSKTGAKATPKREQTQTFMHRSTASRIAYLTPPKESPKRREVKIDTGSDQETDKAILAGRRLYANALDVRSNLEAIRAQKQAAEELKIQQHTFRPTMSRYSQDIVELSMYRPPSARFDPLDQQMSDRRKLQRAHQKLSAEEEEVRLCTFRPELNAVSVQLAHRTRTSSQSRVSASTSDGDTCFDRLHQGGEERIRRLQELKEELATKDANDKIGALKISPRRAVEHADRLLSWGLRKEELMEQMRKELTEHHHLKVPKRKADEVVERLQPRSSSVPPNPTETTGRPISHTEAARRDHLREETHQPKVGAVSTHLAALSKHSRYERAFKRFSGPEAAGTGDYDGITVSVGDIRGMVRNVYTKDNGILAAFVHEPDTKRHNLESFSKALAQFEHLYGPQRWGREDMYSLAVNPAKAGPVHTHVPMLSEETIRIVSERRQRDAEQPHHQPLIQQQPQLSKASPARRPSPTMRSGSTHERLYELGRAHHQRLAAEAKHPDQPLDPECTFQPTISKRSKRLSQRQLVTLAFDDIRADGRGTPLRRNISARQASSTVLSPAGRADALADGAISPMTDEEDQRRRAAANRYIPEGLNATAAVRDYIKGSPVRGQSDILTEISQALHSSTYRQPHPERPWASVTPMEISSIASSSLQTSVIDAAQPFGPTATLTTLADQLSRNAYAHVNSQPAPKAAAGNTRIIKGRRPTKPVQNF